MIQSATPSLHLKHLALIRSPPGSSEVDVPLKIAVGFAKGSLSLISPTRGEEAAKEVRSGHCKHVYGLACHPVAKSVFATVGEDGFLCVWDVRGMVCKRRRELFGAGKSAAFSPDGERLAVGMFDGVVLVLDFEEVVGFGGDNGGRLKTLHVIHDCEEDIDDLKYSPDGKVSIEGGVSGL